MRQAYAHEGVVVMAPGSDERAPGGAITVALCGALDHEPPCPLAAHHTAAERRGAELHLRILFAAPPDRCGEVRGRIDAALGAGSFTGPDGRTTTWRTLRTECSTVAPGERAHAKRLLHGGGRPAGTTP